MNWTNERPTRAGFYYWQNNHLRAISEHAVRVVYVGMYAYREGFACHTLTRMGEASEPVFDCDLMDAPPGRWAGPLPQPDGQLPRSMVCVPREVHDLFYLMAQYSYFGPMRLVIEKALAEAMAAMNVSRYP